MPLPNIHKKLFAENGSGKLLREDIIPWSESPFSSVPIVSKHFTTASAISSGEAVSTRGCGYRPGTGSLMVFMDGLCLDEGVHYAEAESGEEITLLFDCQAGVVFEFVAHDGYEYVPSASFSYTVAPGSTDELSYCPIAPNGITVGSITIDWGDGSDAETLSVGTSTSTPKHAYPTDDGTRYQITLSATEETWRGVIGVFFGMSVDSTTPLSDDDEPSPYATDQTSCRVRYLVSVDSALPAIGYPERDYMFDNNRLLESIPENLFSAQAGLITTFEGCFYYCESLTSLPSGLFSGCSAATDFHSLFYYCDGLASVPEGLFDDCSAATNFNDCFCRCSKLTTVPESLFAKCVNVTTFNECFYNLTSSFKYTLDLTSVPNVTSATRFSYRSTSDSYLSSKVVKVPCGSVTNSTFGDGTSSSFGCTVECVEV